MEYILIAIKDKVADKFMTPTCVENRETAKRLFAYQISKIDLWKENPEQFELYDLGLFDAETGNITGNDDHFDNKLSPTIHPELICKGTDLIERS